jgi:hypothetical protein
MSVGRVWIAIYVGMITIKGVNASLHLVFYVNTKARYESLVGVLVLRDLKEEGGHGRAQSAKTTIPQIYEHLTSQTRE